MMRRLPLPRSARQRALLRFGALALLTLAFSTQPILAAELCTPSAPAADLAWLSGLLQGPRTVGEEIRLTFASPDFALKRLIDSEAPARVAWQEILHDPGATYIAPHFSRFDLPSGAILEIRSPDNSRRWSYSGRGKAEAGPDGFWGIHIPGDTAIVEIRTRVPIREGAVVIDSYARGYPKAGPQPAAICGVDDSDWAQCYQSSEPTIYDRGRAVARLLINGTSGCTGWLVGDEGHLMTNNHCIGSASSAANTDYEFMAEGSCGQDCFSFGACPGTVVATSATFVRTDAGLDYTLVLLPTNPTATYGFLQMRNAGPAVDERIYIPGHPGAWGKRISVDSDNANDQSGFCEVFSLNSPACTGGPRDIGYFCDTRGGSSGSPVLAYSDHAVVSLHHCANCPNRGAPIDLIITDLGNDLPNNSTTDGSPPPPPPPPSCFAKGDPCSVNSDCCSNKCKGKPGAKTCK